MASYLTLPVFKPPEDAGAAKPQFTFYERSPIMQWLAENWLWVVGGVLLLVVIYVFTRPKKPRQPSDREMAAMVAGLVNALERVVDDAIGRNYSRTDRQKIAIGMVAVMMSQDISLDRLTSNPALFATVMAKSVATLQSAGEISVR
jgi:hypothetical protein